jgi:hypothetical protein
MWGRLFVLVLYLRHALIATTITSEIQITRITGISTYSSIYNTSNAI